MPTPNPSQRRALERFLDELDVWNRRLNLTTVTRDRAWERHVEESLHLLDAAAPPPGGRCADLGSGGGVPGVVVAVVRTDLPVTLIEADRRKAGFLVHVCGLLELDHVTVAARRAEEMATDPAHRTPTTPSSRVPRLARAALVPGGSPAPRGRSAVGARIQADAGTTVTALADQAGARAENPAPGVLSVRRRRR